MRHLLLLPSLFALVAAQAPASVDSFLAQPDYTPASAAEVKAMCDSFLGRAAAMRPARACSPRGRRPSPVARPAGAASRAPARRRTPSSSRACCMID